MRNRVIGVMSVACISSGGDVFKGLASSFFEEEKRRAGDYHIEDT